MFIIHHEKILHMPATQQTHLPAGIVGNLNLKLQTHVQPCKSSSFKGCWASLFKYSSSNLNQHSVLHIINQGPMSTTSFHDSINLQDCQNFLIPNVIGIMPDEWNHRNGLTQDIGMAFRIIPME